MLIHLSCAAADSRFHIHSDWSEWIEFEMLHHWTTRAAKAINPVRNISTQHTGCWIQQREVKLLDGGVWNFISNYSIHTGTYANSFANIHFHTHTWKTNANAIRMNRKFSIWIERSEKKQWKLARIHIFHSTKNQFIILMWMENTSRSICSICIGNCFANTQWINSEEKEKKKEEKRNLNAIVIHMKGIVVVFFGRSSSLVPMWKKRRKKNFRIQIIAFYCFRQTKLTNLYRRCCNVKCDISSGLGLMITQYVMWAMRVLPLHMPTAWHSPIIMGYDSIYFLFRFFFPLLFASHCVVWRLLAQLFGCVKYVYMYDLTPLPNCKYYALAVFVPFCFSNLFFIYVFSAIFGQFDM